MPEKTLKTGNRTDHQISAESSPISISGSKSVVEVENTNGDLEQNDYSAENTRSLQTNEFTDTLGSNTDEHINVDQLKSPMTIERTSSDGDIASAMT